MQYRLNGKFTSFKNFVKVHGLDAVNYNDLESREKRIYNGIETASNRLRIGGEFIHKPLESKIRKYAKNNEMEVNEYIKKNREVIETYMKEQSITNTYNDQKITDMVDLAAKGKMTIYINDEKVSRIEATKRLKELDNYLKSNYTVPAWYTNLKYKINKKEVSFKLPDIKDIKGMKEEKLKNFLSDNFDISLIFSPKKTAEEDDEDEGEDEEEEDNNEENEEE